MNKYLDTSRGGATLMSADGIPLRAFVWPLGGGHLSEIVGEGDRQKRVEVMITKTATLGYVKDDADAIKQLAKHLKVKDIR